jgi:flavin reductase (DIM6/NTAB) family NADH-FMN oxidoreductase RutF
MADLAGISEDDFKKGMRELAAAVNIITVAHNGSQDGLTATAACSVSAEPPQLLICVNSDAGGHNLIQESGKFALNVLARDQEAVAMRFAGMDGADRSERFGLGSWSELVTGTPVLDGALVNFDCEVAEQITAGSHSIFIGHIVASRTADQDGAPLLYGDGQFTGLATRE